MKNIFFFAVAGLMMIGSITVYAVDEKTGEKTTELTSNPLAAFEVFLQKKRDEIKAKAQRNNPDEEMFSYEEVVLNEMEKLIELVDRMKTNRTGTVPNDRLSPEITDYMIAQFFVLDETIRTTFIEIFKGPLPVSISFPPEWIQILSAIAEDKALFEEQVNYLRENSIPFDYEGLYVGGDTLYHGIYRKIRIGTPGYGESFRRTSIRALGVIGKHQELPFETLLILAEGMTDPLENGYVTEASYEALKVIGPDYSSFFSPKINEKFEGLFTADINYWMDSDEIVNTVSKVSFMQGQWKLQADAADLFATIAKNKKIPPLLLSRMVNILFYQLDESKLKKIRDSDFQFAMSFVNSTSPSFLVRKRMKNHLDRKRNEALESSRERLNKLKVSVAGSFGEIGKYQALLDDVIQAMERLNSSEMESPNLRQTLQAALTSISGAKESLQENSTGSVCESSMKDSEEGS